MLMDLTAKEFVADVASKKPAPGGGSVAALVGSLGAALTTMVGNLTIGRKAYDKLTEEQQKQLDENFKKVEGLVERLNELVDEDTTSFNGVMKAFKMPKETEEEKKARSKAIQEATKEALEVPLDTAIQCLEVLKLQKVFALYGNQNAITDAGVGALLAYAGLEGALFNVKINLGSIKDSEYVEVKNKKCEEMLKEGNQLKEEVLEIVYKAL
ncbi:cyclodeaminase/cyclohydrolase family protein [Dethiothermospora halolimnae]|uniref:cyclodeaminase/cyclohydrolase family protein n=1 Tax=Dethiothermospora halolimnae TaxID=3114390 RepID=UPI003CCC253F